MVVSIGLERIRTSRCTWSWEGGEPQCLPALEVPKCPGATPSSLIAFRMTKEAPVISRRRGGGRLAPQWGLPLVVGETLMTDHVSDLSRIKWSLATIDYMSIYIRHY